jgi:hypothetical protein
MSKAIKLIISIFVGADIFVVSYLALSQLRHILFGTGDIPGGGSALDMALFLIPLFIGYVSGDRLYYFLTYSERRQAKLAAGLTKSKPPTPSASVVATTAGVASGLANPVHEEQPSIWQDSNWDDSALTSTRGTGVTNSEASPEA